MNSGVFITEAELKTFNSAHIENDTALAKSDARRLGEAAGLKRDAEAFRVNKITGEIYFV